MRRTRRTAFLLGRRTEEVKKMPIFLDLRRSICRKQASGKRKNEPGGHPRLRCFPKRPWLALGWGRRGYPLVHRNHIRPGGHGLRYVARRPGGHDYVVIVAGP